MAAKNKLINLLPQEEFEGSLTGRILRWAMTTFRFIVIVTEMIVMGAFLSRFWLDAKNSDLNEALRVSVAQISAQAPFEQNFRDLQDRMKIFQELDNEKSPSEILTHVMAKIPSEVVVQSFSYLEGSLQIKGSSTGEIGVAQFVANLKSDTSFKKVELGQIGTSSENESLITFNIGIEY